ncbi:MAG: hypothetical protein M9921_11730 [Fimbriimonadaceae bacterium]|nr:hypothetical protein [Fimbriimonadaceae bacterium]
MLPVKVELQAGDPRLVLTLLAGPVEGCAEPLSYPADRCPNCGSRCSSTRSPYCSAHCRAEAAFVRQFRAARDQGTLADPERQAHLGQALWHLLGGGYPHRVTLIPPSAQRQVLKREEGKCQECGAPATTFDHVGSG